VKVDVTRETQEADREIGDPGRGETQEKRVFGVRALVGRRNSG